MRYVVAFGRFWYDFIIGDDWKIAVAVVTALAVTCALMLSGAVTGPALAVLGGAIVVVCFAVSLAVDVRRKS
ncbi:MAG: hypothetical protein J2P24_11575 [Streptosporangiales bacterium]|nr:hypothetical protein [Streptosporangiales bacterium]MBO0890598.1 hypothetical protein [Acidothermales bacterium]